MAPNRGRNRQHEFEELVETGAKDFDPEEEVLPSGDTDGSGSEQDDEDFDGREHYVNVSKSRLRKSKPAPLGPQYRGSKVARDALQIEDEDDPFTQGFDSESSEQESDVHAADQQIERDSMAGSETEGDMDESEEDDELDDGTDDTDLGDDEEASLQLAKGQRHNKQVIEELREPVKESSGAQIAQALSQANREEVEKGRAVKKQRAAFDSLLNVRMKLHKSLIAANSLVGTPPKQLQAEREEAKQALEGAEKAAFNLWTAVSSFQEELSNARAGKKRKRSNLSMEDPTEVLWAHMRTQEADSQPTRHAILSKWSSKAQEPSARPKSELVSQPQQATVIDVLRGHLRDPARLLARVHTPRSCAPLQLSRQITEDSKIYDDADFYGLLLKELLQQKSQDSVAASNIDLSFQMRREAKTKRTVDTKASKGRKLRYTVHDKLQNFMAPEDRTKWGERQADDLFASLFGQRFGLAEGDNQDEELTGIDANEAELLMFRS